MKIFSLVWAFVAILLLAVGCAATHQNVPLASPQAPVPADKARVVVIRQYKYNGFATGRAIQIRDSGAPVGDLGLHSYLAWDRAPGKTIIGSAKSPGLSLDLKPGEVTYIKAALVPGCGSTHEDLEELNAMPAQQALAKAHPPR